MGVVDSLEPTYFAVYLHSFFYVRFGEECRFDVEAECMVLYHHCQTCFSIPQSVSLDILCSPHTVYLEILVTFLIWRFGGQYQNRQICIDLLTMLCPCCATAKFNFRQY